MSAALTTLSQIETAVYRTARALRAVGSIAEADGQLGARGVPHLSLVRSEDFSCLMEVLGTELERHGDAMTEALCQLTREGVAPPSPAG